MLHSFLLLSQLSVNGSNDAILPSVVWKGLGFHGCGSFLRRLIGVRVGIQGHPSSDVQKTELLTR